MPYPVLSLDGNAAVIRREPDQHFTAAEHGFFILAPVYIDVAVIDARFDAGIRRFIAGADLDAPIIRIEIDREIKRVRLQFDAAVIRLRFQFP